jgi:hypothetical protein
MKRELNRETGDALIARLKDEKEKKPIDPVPVYLDSTCCMLPKEL